MKFIDLFAGIGGIRLGMEQAGHECVGWVEWDKFARKSYIAVHKPDGEFTEKDINDVTSQELPKADCWCFGFPCQDISVAGKQGGFTNGKRSSLFFKVTGLIRKLKEENRPSYLFIENVKNLLSINKGWDFTKLLIEMDEIGYDVEWDVLDSAGVVPQHRERIFIVGHLRGQRTRKVFPIIRENKKTDKPDKVVNQIGNISNSKSFGGNPQVGRVYGTDGIAPTLSTMQGGGQEPKILEDYRVRKLTPLETWRLQGFPDWAFNRARKAGLSDSQLYKQAGNSVTVPVIKTIADRMGLNEFNVFKWIEKSYRTCRE
ncbi:DNA (cytosine-5-)-methyltransferase [Pediococcus acidilactici]|uniref:DNA cytosine methyltransferase n=1 Tax=Pediococcus acidilactici TaxID=1254 RepID=UPI00132F6E9D|nr:DNA cytosine methyltransferase [Pediococcus acidilactici]KAF0510584.1 DNA (cytosine-5-)-methyltransferase [Pediococcus acidilactici]